MQPYAMTLALKNSLANFHAQSRCFSNALAHDNMSLLKSARGGPFIREQITQVVKNALRGLQRFTDEHVNVKTYVFNRQGSSSLGNRPDHFSRFVHSGQPSSCGSETWPSTNLMDWRKNWCQTSSRLHRSLLIQFCPLNPGNHPEWI